MRITPVFHQSAPEKSSSKPLELKFTWHLWGLTPYDRVMVKKPAHGSFVLVDVGNSAFATTILAAVFPIYMPSLLPEGGVTLSLFGFEWKTAAISLWAYTVSLSILITLLISPIVGAWADEKGKRKKLLGAFTAIGSLATICLGLLKEWQLVLPCFVVANICFASGNVFYNSLLPSAAEEKDWHKLSMKGFAWGYFGGGVLLAINLAMIMKYDLFGFPDKAAGTRASFITVGLWWMAFTIPALINIHEVDHTEVKLGRRALQRVKQLWYTLKDLPHYPMLLLFIVAYAFFNDGIQTVISMSSIYGKEEVGLPEGTLIGTLLMIQFLGLPATLGMSWLAPRVGPKRLLVSALVFWVFIIIYAFFMTVPLDFWILGAMVALVLGVSQALARSIFTGLIPGGRHAEFFAFYAFSGKLSAVMGPLLFGIIQDVTGSARYSILSLALFFFVGLVFLSFVSIDPKKADL